MLGWLRSKLYRDKVEKGSDKDVRYLEYIVERFLHSKKRLDMITGERYYLGHHDILWTKREVIGEDGRLTEVDNLPNNKRIDNQYEKLVDQKVNYLLGKPLTFQTDNQSYQEQLKKVFGLEFHRIIKNLGEDALNGGIAWIYPHYNDKGEFVFKRFEPCQILPVWKDEGHTDLEFVIRIYTIQEWTGSMLEDVEIVDVYSLAGIDRYKYHYGTLKYDSHYNYFNIGEEQFNWDRLPVIPFKYNLLEKPLILRVKNLQDGINKAISNFENNLDENPRNCILILKNYDGQKLGEFRKNLSTYGAVKVRNDGGVEKLTVELNAQNYKDIIKIFKDALIENGRGFNAKDDRLGNNPNEMNIQSMYADIDLDATGMEVEFRSGLEKLLYFVNAYFSHMGFEDFENEKVDIIFNKDILVNESQTIANCKASVGIISDETIIAQHPWIKNPVEELEKIKKQKEKELDTYGGAFGNSKNPDDVDE